MDVITGTPEYHSSSKKPMREILILAFSFLFVFTSFQALQNLQSSLNQLQGLGVASLASIYGTSFAVSFFTPAIVYNIGVKGAMLMAWLGHCVYVACNFYPHWATLIPGSVLLGFISCPLWISLNTYVSSLARVSVEQDFAKAPKKVTTIHTAFSKLNGVFFSIFTASQLTGNLLSSTILHQSTYNETEVTSSYATSWCGADYCPEAGEGEELAPPQPFVIYTMLCVFLVLDLIGLGVTWRCLPNLEQPRYTGREILRKLRSYWVAFSQPKLWLLVPLFASRGMNFSLRVGMFTEAYVSCALGIRMVGYVMAAWGLSTMLCSGLLGYAARFTGRRFLFIFAFLVEAAILLAWLLWRPHSGSVLVFFCLAALMGLVDGLWVVQCDAFVAVLFPAIVDSAFSVSGTWHSLSMASSFLLAKFLCPRNRLRLALGFLGAAVLGYVAVEIAHWRSLKTVNRDEHHYMLVNSSERPDERNEEGVRETEFGADEAEVTNGGIS